ncbi:hypothetical protein SDC9_142454 [bioreactor metagenome]|uniref:Penicillin-binding protein transpeptidase domain-containing protein n=1 Tax=bioreactor metagenome TaxID=1076179 RepID=A0A645E0J3_9ZZZZ
MYDMLKEPVRAGTAYKANTTYKSRIPLAGKTGSSTNFKNLWFCGLTPYYSGAVWIENKNNQGIYSSDAAYIMGRIMNEAVKDLPVKDIVAPSGITSSAVDRVSGLLPTELSYRDPRGSQVYTELFIKGTVPTSTDNIHVEAKINKNNGKIASLYTPFSLTVSKVFIKRDYVPSVYLGDQPYVLPKELDNTIFVPETPAGNNNTDTDNDNDNDSDDEQDEGDEGDEGAINNDTSEPTNDNLNNSDSEDTTNTTLNTFNKNRKNKKKQI